MTIQQLIDELKTYPPDLLVLTKENQKAFETVNSLLPMNVYKKDTDYFWTKENNKEKIKALVLTFDLKKLITNHDSTRND